MKNKRAISLIVLVVTILVLSILAATVIITLSNTNIISEANKSVKSTRRAQVKEMANVVQADYMLNQADYEKKGVTLQMKMNEAIKDAGYTTEELRDDGIFITLDGEVEIVEEAVVVLFFAC